ncbi:MAG: hypothetical protein PHE27_04305 [Alphaproteobacteria bacterium]|nr:hypothetical protein [Alphaproteobacteria bacterium]
MAKDEAKQQTATKAAPRKKGKVKFVLAMLLACVAMPFMLPTVLLLLAGFGPTYVAFWTDDDPEKSGATCVSAMNFAGLSPFLIELWLKGQTTAHAFSILSDPHAWFVILGTSAVGQLIAHVVPQAIATMSATNAETRVKALKKNLDLLKQSWGDDVGSVKTENPGS